MGDGNDFQQKLVAPSTERLLELAPGERVLDAACGNGVTARRLTDLGAQVVGFDFAPDMIEHARARSRDRGDAIEYHLIDATDEDAMLRLGAGSFDAAICNMAIMDIAEIDPLMSAVCKLLKPNGRFVFSICHPCFNQTSSIKVVEQEEIGGKINTNYAMKISRYLQPRVERGLAMIGQPEPQLYFERPLRDLFGACFRAQMLVDGLDEAAFDGTPVEGRIISWDRFTEIPPLLVLRARPSPVLGDSSGR